MQLGKVLYNRMTHYKFAEHFLCQENSNTFRGMLAPKNQGILHGHIPLKINFLPLLSFPTKQRKICPYLFEHFFAQLYPDPWQKAVKAPSANSHSIFSKADARV